jgi:GntR family histidine utilization transcriptional repressor
MHTYEEIKQEILRRINQQVWPTGYTLPHETKLAEEFNVARGTIRQALTSLVDAGLIERRRRAGTRVVDRKSHSSKLTIPLVRHEIETLGKTYSYRLILNEAKGAGVKSAAFPAGSKLRHIICLHMSDGRPYQLEDRLLNLDTVPAAREETFETISPNEWLLSQVPYSSVRTVLRAETASAQDERYLELKTGDPVFIIERQTYLEGEPLTSVRMSHPAHSFQIVTKTE